MTFEKINFKKAKIEDIHYLLWLRKVTMSDYMLNSGLEVNDKEQLNRINYNFDDAKIIYFDEEKIGLLKISERETEIEIVQIQLDPSFQGKGIGRLIFESIIKNAKNKNKTLFLSVLKANPAKKLYDSLGFKTINTTNDSFEMRLNF